MLFVLHPGAFPKVGIEGVGTMKPKSELPPVIAWLHGRKRSVLDT